jgi:hypothetical protein
MGRLPEAWLAPLAVRELPELVPASSQAVQVRSGFMAGGTRGTGQAGLHLQVKYLFGPRGRAELAAAPLDRAYRARVNAYLRLVDAFDVEVGLADGWIAARLTGHEGYRADPGHPWG